MKKINMNEQDEEYSNNKYKIIQKNQLFVNRFTTNELCLSSNKLKCCKNWNHNKNNTTKNVYLQNH